MPRLLTVAAPIALHLRQGPGILGAAQAEPVQDVLHVSFLCIPRLSWLHR